MSTLTALFYAEKAAGVLCRYFAYLFGRHFAYFSDPFDDILYHARVAPFAAKRLGRHVGRVGLYHKSVERHIFNDLYGAAGVFKGNNARKGYIITAL